MIELLGRNCKPGMIGICHEWNIGGEDKEKIGKIFFVNDYHPARYLFPGPMFPGLGGWYTMTFLENKIFRVFPKGSMIPVFCKNRFGSIQLANMSNSSMQLSSFKPIVDISFSWKDVEPSWIVARSLA